MESIAGTKTQSIKLGKIFVHYPYIICFNIEHRSEECPKKIEVYTMFRIKPISYNATRTPKSLKINNVPINVIVIVTTRNQQSEQ
jgi:hypothetical protein